MKTLASAAVVALTLFAAACDDASVAPQPEPRFAASQSGKLDKVAKYRNGPPQITIGFAMKAIGPAGGKISLVGFEVEVPRGAVDKWTNFTIRLPVDPKASSYVFAEFGPHGSKFNKPVTLRLPYRGTTSDDSEGGHVLWYNGSDWVKLPTSPTGDGRIQALTDHFSEYGTEEFEPQKGITTAGGN